MAEPRYLQAECAFRPGAHTVRVTLTRSTLRVEVEAHGTADLWRGEFDATFIEDLTRKTGNFKQFGIFCSMLESALTQSSDSVSLELLTYTDLETLHSRKVGVTRPPPSTRSPLNTKRYLILVYSVEFDRIHYPLPLPYAGRPDLVALVRELQEQLAQLRAQRLEETQHLRDGLPDLTQAKASEKRLQLRVKNLTAELASCKRGCGTLGNTHPGVGTGHSSCPPHPDPLLCLPLPGSRPPRFDPTAFVRARQCRQKEAELRKVPLTSPHSHFSLQLKAPGAVAWEGALAAKAVSALSPCPAGNAGVGQDVWASLLAPFNLHALGRDRRVTRTRRPLSISSCNVQTFVNPFFMHPPENHIKESSAELAEIDARLQALQEYMDSLNTRM
uniref:Centrosomal protein CCDC61 n=1 Tax=Catharus ustulatus TaxID=91951 RepID=A0A8C3VBG5_CATUS